MNPNVDKIQDYIDGLLVGEELTTFENQLAQDKELQDMVALHREVGAIIHKREGVDTSALLTNLKAAESTVRRSGTGSVISFKKWIPMLAAACALVIFAVYYFRNTEDLYALPSMRSEIVRGQEVEESYEDAVKAFNSNDYIKANEILIALIDQDSSRIQYHYYAALTYVGQEAWAEAIEQLTPIAAGESVFADEAKYYLAIAYSKTDQKAEAIALLTSISGTGKLGERAGKLLKELH